MPTYLYECGGGHEFEWQQKITDEPLLFCPMVILNPRTMPGYPSGYVEHVQCGKPVKKLIAKTSFILKGDGWSKDGYGGKKK